MYWWETCRWWFRKAAGEQNDLWSELDMAVFVLSWNGGTRLPDEVSQSDWWVIAALGQSLWMSVIKKTSKGSVAAPATTTCKISITAQPTGIGTLKKTDVCVAIQRVGCVLRESMSRSFIPVGQSMECVKCGLGYPVKIELRMGTGNQPMKQSNQTLSCPFCGQLPDVDDEDFCYQLYRSNSEFHVLWSCLLYTSRCV